MEYIAHRVNTLAALKELPQTFGAEIDLRDGLDGRIYLQHDPFVPGEDFETWLKSYRHGTLILNVKSERVEFEARRLTEQRGITRFFFLDSSFPMIRLLTDTGEKRLALRYSELEGMETLRTMAGLAEWVWVDCFTRMPLERREWLEMKGLGYKICLVSPELLGRPEEAASYRLLMMERGISVDAVCGKAASASVWLEKRSCFENPSTGRLSDQV